MPLIKALHACRSYPFITGVLCAASKGAAADGISQRFLQDGEYQPVRTAAFAAWNGIYCGAVVYAMYSVLAPRWLPTTLGHPQMLRNALLLVGIDNFLATPLFCLPTYYICHAAVDASSDGRQPAAIVRTGLSNYIAELRPTLALSWSFWIPIHLATFTVVPSALRVHFTAACSFGTLMFMSALQGQLEMVRGSRAEKQARASAVA